MTTLQQPPLATSAPPERVRDGGGVSEQGSAYRRAYRLTAPAGSCLLQRVRVRIQYRLGSRVLVDYRSTYHEFFAFDADDSSVLDVHDFELRRDGWDQGAIERLLRANGRVVTARGAGGVPRLLLTKAFTLGLGQVRGTQAVDVARGVRFGFLASAHGCATRGQLTLQPDPAQPARTIAVASPAPGRLAIAGDGEFAADRVFRQCERFDYRFACLAGSLRDRDGYRAANLLSQNNGDDDA